MPTIFSIVNSITAPLPARLLPAAWLLPLATQSIRPRVLSLHRARAVRLQNAYWETEARSASLEKFGAVLGAAVFRVPREERTLDRMLSATYCLSKINILFPAADCVGDADEVV